MKTSARVGATLIALSLYAAQGVAMSLFSGEDVYVFSALEGHLTYQGQPAAGAKIIRHVAWKDTQGESDETHADDNGYFHFPSMQRKLRQVLPAQFVAHQKITVIFEEEEYVIWRMGNLNKEEFGELGGRPVNLRCEITDELARVEAPAGLLGTSCTWERLESKHN